MAPTPPRSTRQGIDMEVKEVDGQDVAARAEAAEAAGDDVFQP